MNRHLSRHLATAAAVVTMIAATGCGGTPGSSPGSAASTPSGAVQKSGFGKLGPVHLTIWSYDNQDPGLEPVLKELSANFEKQYPNVKITMVFKDFNSLVNVVPRALASGSGPDITEGNQGYQTDAQLVKAGLIVPLDRYLKAYGWDKWYSPSTWSMFRWTNDGKTFGKGPTWGVAQTGQNINVFVNTENLKKAGLNLSDIPKTFDGFNAMLGQIRAKLPKSEPVIEFGNNEGYGTIHMFGGIQAAFFGAQDERNWIEHVPGSTWDTPDNVKALEAYQAWAKNGYFNSDYNALKYDQSAAEFAKGKGVFWMGGDWDASIIKSGLGDKAAVINVPPGDSGTWAGVGGLSGPWHISSKTKYPDLAAAWLNYIIASPDAQRLMYEQQQIPSPSNAMAPPAGDPFLAQVTDAFRQVADDDGLMLYTDWASPTMYDTLASNFQDLLAGRISAQDMAKNVQDDWEKFDQTLNQ
jgi:raffinose/stachyose/melibiose transport system substrate-binding protein